MTSHNLCVMSVALFVTALSYRIGADDGGALLKEVVASGEAIVEQLTPEEARQAALRKALTNGIEKALGLEVVSQTQVRDFYVMGSFIKTLSRGHIMGEEVVRWEQLSYQEAPDKPPLTTYKVTLRMKIRPLQGDRDPYFKVSAELNKSLFLEGDTATIKIVPSKTCYLAIFSLTSKDEISLLFPHANQNKNLVKQNSEFVFPGSAFKLYMAPYADHRRDVEAFLLIATKKPVDFASRIGRTDDIPLTDLYHALLDIPVSEWAEEIIPYEVRKR